MCVTERLIDKLQQDYFAGRDLGQSIPGMGETKASTIVAESLVGDYLWEHLPQIMTGDTSGFQDKEFGDWGKAVMAELFFGVVDVARKMNDEGQQRTYKALAWSLLEDVCKSPTASPMLWYEDIFFDVGQEWRMKGEPYAVEFFKRSLAHNLHYDKGNNVSSILIELAETYLWINDFDAGLAILAALVLNVPANIWPYNLMALIFDHFGLTKVGEQAIQRGLELLKAKGDPEELHDQLHRCLDRMKQSKRHGREADVDPTVLTDLRAALSMDFDAGKHRPDPELCRRLVPDLDQIPVKRPPDKPDLPPPNKTPPQRKKKAPPSSQRIGRNDPCWCGSGKKYKHCHRRTDQRRK